MDWPQMLLIFGTCVLSFTYTGLCVYLVYKFKTRGQQGQCIQASPQVVQRRKPSDKRASAVVTLIHEREVKIRSKIFLTPSYDHNKQILFFADDINSVDWTNN